MSKFQPLSHYQAGIGQGYKLLPLRFSELDADRFVLSNFVGEFVVLDKITAKDFLEHRLSNSSPCYEDLKSKHFLLDADSSVAIDLLALKTRTRLERISNFTGLHLFVVTLRCEHSCPYCQVSRQNDDKTDFDMSVEVADKSLDLVFRSPSPHIKIEFQGGEPLLNFSLIRHVVENAEKRNETEKKDLGFVIATNLAVISDDILNYCREHAIHISTSLDGPADLHNKNRPRPGGDSYQKAVSGIGRVRTALGRDQISAVMTTTSASLKRARDIIDEYIALGFESIFLRPLSPYGFAVKTKSYNAYDVEKWLRFYFEGLDYIIDLNRNGLQFKETYASTILTKMLTPFQPGYVDLMSPAGIGIGALLYNYDGSVFASDESRMLAEMGDKSFRIGSVADSYETIISSDALLDPLEQSFAASAPMCSTCAYEPYCGADPVYHHATQGDYVGRKPLSGFCNRNMAIFKGLIIRMEADPEIRRLFIRWANR
jgi:uncharacterized protein